MKTFRGRKGGEEPVENFSYFLGGTPYNRLLRRGSARKGTFFRLQVDERVGIAPVKVYIDRSQSPSFS